MGEFEWKGKTYEGKHEALVSRELWERVQGILDRKQGRPRGSRNNGFAFSGLITCGLCGCALSAQIKKERYVYYHCTGYKGKCGEPYVREEVLNEAFASVLEQIALEDVVVEWVKDALRQSHADEKRFHDESVDRLQTQYELLQNRIDRMYLDRLDGRIDIGFFERMAEGRRKEQRETLQAIEQHQTANHDYISEGTKLLELAQRAHVAFKEGSPVEKKRLLSVVLSNSSWKDAKLSVTFRQPFDLLVKTPKTNPGRKHSLSGDPVHSEKWYAAIANAFRTACMIPARATGSQGRGPSCSNLCKLRRRISIREGFRTSGASDI